MGVALLFLQAAIIGVLCGVLIDEQPESAIASVAILAILRLQIRLGSPR